MHPELTILLHSSKTMRMQKVPSDTLRQPKLIKEAEKLDRQLKKLSAGELASVMHISPGLALKTKDTVRDWSAEHSLTPAIDSFIGDIYSGLRAGEFSVAERDYADTVLRILSGMYGILRPNDGIRPYRLEMGYRLPGIGNLYDFWGDKIAKQLPGQGAIVNVSSVEYTKVVLPFIDPERVVTPNFLTVNPKTGTPGFTVVHAKIARGAFARWLITTRITDPQRFCEFNDLGYVYDQSRSMPDAPVFVCQKFDGLGLSIRLQ